MRILIGVVALLLVFNVQASAQYTAPVENSHFDAVRDIYLSDDIVYGETDVLAKMLIAIGRKDANPQSKLRQLAEGYGMMAYQYRFNPIFKSGTEEREAAAEKLKAYKLKICDELFPLVDREKLVQQVQKENRRFLDWCNECWVSYDLTYLTNSQLVSKLKLTAQQKKRLADEHEKITKYQDELWDEFGDAYYEFANQALSEINEVLDTEQRKRFKTLIGTPVNWARMIESHRKFEYVFRVSDPNGKLESLNLRRGPTNPAESVAGSPKVDLFLFMLLSTEFFRKELDLTDEQEQKLVSTLKEYRKHRIIDESESVERFEQLLSSDVTFPKEVDDLLLRHQEECLQQVELQFRTGNYRFSFGSLHPKLVEKLELTTRQQAKIKRVSDRFSKEVNAFSTEAKIQFANLMGDRYLDTLKVLNSDQRIRYSLLTGFDTTSIQSK